MFERFTDSAKHCIKLAQEEATEGRAGCIATEHLWVALMREGYGLAANALGKCGVNENELRAWAENANPPVHPAPSRVPFTPNAKRTLELALREALRLADNYIGTEHILLALCRQRIDEPTALTGPLPDALTIQSTVLKRIKWFKSQEHRPKENAVRSALRPYVAPNNLEEAIQKVMDLPA